MAIKSDLFVVSAGRITAVVMALISVRAVTTFLTPDQYGELSILATVQMFCGLLLINPVGQHINLHTHVWWDDGSLLARLKSYRAFVLVASLVGGAVMLSINSHNRLDQWLWTATVMFGMVAAGTWNSTLIPMLNMLGFRTASVLCSTITVTSGLATSVFLVTWLPSAASWFAGQAIGMVVGVLCASYFLRRHTVRSQNSLTKRPLMNRLTFFTYCLPLALATGFMWIQLSGYRFLIESYWGLAQLGFIVIGFQLAGQIWGLVESLAMQFLYPLFYRRVSDHENRKAVESAFSDLLNTLVPVYFIVTGSLVISSPYLLRLLVAPKFQDAMTFIMFGAAIELCRVLSNLLSIAAHVRRKTKSLTLPYALGSITVLILIYFSGLLNLEIMWVGVMLLIGSIVMFATMLISMYSQVKFVIDNVRIFSSAAIMVTMIIISVIMPKISGINSVIGMLILQAIIAGVIIFALLWKNIATLRLFSVKLNFN